MTFETAEILPNIFVRSATRADVPSIVRLLADDMLGSQRERDVDPLPQSYYDAFERVNANQHVELVVAEMQDEIIGVLQLDFISGLSFQGGTRAQIESVRVDSRHRGRGIGKALFRWAIAFACAKGCYVVQLTTNAERKDAHRFYLDLGFKPSHVGMKLFLE
jgi:GNAT superfamily N-acetyltransferase